MKDYWLPTVPYSFDDAVQRFALSSGIANPESPDVCTDNGKTIFLRWNDYRQYYVAEYNYNGRQVVSRRQNFTECLLDSIAVCQRHGKGAALIVTCHKSEDEQACINLGLVEYSPEIEKAHDATFITWGAADIKAQFDPLELQRALCGIYSF